MKFITAIFCLLIPAFTVLAQKPVDVLATATDKTFTAADLDIQTQQIIQNRQKIIADARIELFAGQVSEQLLAKEAEARKTTVEKLLETEIKSKIPDPSAAQIQAVYDANSEQLKNKPLAEVRPQIVSYLRRAPEQKATENFIAALKTKYRPVFAKDVNAPNLKSSDVLASVGLKQITLKDFEDKNKLALYELEERIYEAVEKSLREAILTNLVSAEAAKENLTFGDIIAREITDKMKDYSDEEKFGLENAFEDRLFKKYQRQNFNERTRTRRPEYFARRRSFTRRY